MKKLLQRLEAAVIAVPYQWIVDKTQLDKSWWMRQCVLLTVVVRVITHAMDSAWDGWAAVRLLGFLLVAGWMMAVTLSDPAIEAWTAPWLRWLVFSFTVPFWPLIFVVPSANPLLVVGDLAYLSYYYFGACKPPAPPKRREQHNLGFSS